MIILGIYSGHNAAVCILRDGEVVLNLELERWTRRKHDFGYREEFVQHCLSLAKLKIDDVDFVATNHWAAGQSLPGVPKTGGVWGVRFAASVLGRTIPALAVNHHLGHVASAFYTSPFERSVVMTLDGGGDTENSSIAYCERSQICTYSPRYVENLAYWWGGVTFNNYRMPRVHEWDPGSGAGKIMALAAYGKPDSDIVNRLLSDMRAPHDQVTNPGYTDPPSVAFNGNEDLSDTKQPRSQALAWALQRYTEKFVTHLFHEAADYGADSENLCYAGGIALNCIANEKALAAGHFKRLHVPPCPNDTGLALGMALYAWHHHMANPRTPGYFSPYVGPVYQVWPVLPPDVQSVDATPSEVALAIEHLGVIAVWRQRSETGPRALGHRSILACTDNPVGRAFLNEQVKQREWYRPFAPIVLSEHYDEMLESATYSPYMTGSATIRESWRARLSAVCHVDNTTRPQVLRREMDPWLYDVIDGVRARTGIPAVLNTSFNRSAPMVETPQQAVDLWLQLPIKALVLDQQILVKP